MSSIGESLTKNFYSPDHRSGKPQNDLSKSSIESSFGFGESHCSTMLDMNGICEEVLDNKMTALELHEIANKTNGGDGSDSGVDIAISLSVGLQRALSSTSGGYASSNGGLDELNICGNISCNSSMISYSSDICESKAPNTILSQNNSNNEATSENGSESSSIGGGPVTRKASIVKKKVAVMEPSVGKIQRKTESPSNMATGQLSRVRSRAASVNRTIPTAKMSCAPILQTRERPRSREKTPATSAGQSSKTTTPPNRSTPIKRPPKPDSLPISLVTASPSLQRMVQRTPSLTRGRTPGSTPTDDGRWPSIGCRGSVLTPKRAGSAAPDFPSIKTRVHMLSLDSKQANAVFDKYATLPRRRREKSADDLRGRSSRSSSASRENKIMTSSVSTPPAKKYPMISTTPSRESTPARMLPPFPKSRKLIPKTKIYAETSVQTALTCEDVENAFAGAAKAVKIDAVEMATRSTQSDIRDKEVESLKDQLRKMTDKFDQLKSRLEDKTQKLTNLELQLNMEREEKMLAQRELHLNTERVIGMLELARGTPTDEGGCDSLLMLESQIQMSGHELEESQQEIRKLRRICRALQTEMDRSLTTQKCLMEEKAAIERESNELQDFLQYEKTAMCDALKDAETETEECVKKLEEKDAEIKTLREECRHLVRLNEQRRQENKGMQSKFSALETRSKDLVVQQSTAVSGASMALSGLSSRLDSLVEQLITSYNISERDLEDVVFHNEAYTNSSGEGSPEFETAAGKSAVDQTDGSLSPQRNQSFIAAVISAIRGATTSTAKKPMKVKKPQEHNNEDESDSTEMLDSETEPCLMMDNVLEDVTMPDSHSHNMVSSSCGNGMMISQIEIPSDLLRADESLQNLSQAIADRKQIEMQISNMTVQKSTVLRQQSEQSTTDDLSAHDSINEIPSISDYCSAQALVDQVIDVDNLVTKLLKVLRLIQMDNDSCIQHLISDKNKLQLNKEEMLEKLKEWEDLNAKLRDELQNASHQLILKGTDLSSSKAELQRHRNEIDRLNQDICDLSILCSHQSQQQTGININNDNKLTTITKDDLISALRLWHENGSEASKSNDAIEKNVQECKKMPQVREMFDFTSEKLNSVAQKKDKCVLRLPVTWHENAIRETKRQYEAIDKALEVLHSIQGVVQQCPALTQLQHDLEETNFQSASSIPMFTALLAAATSSVHNDLMEEDVTNANNESGNTQKIVSLKSLALSCDNNSGSHTEINSPA